MAGTFPPSDRMAVPRNDKARKFTASSELPARNGEDCGLIRIRCTPSQTR